MPTSRLLAMPSAAPRSDPNPATPRPHANTASAPLRLRPASMINTSQATISNSTLPVERSALDVM